MVWELGFTVIDELISRSEGKTLEFKRDLSFVNRTSTEQVECFWSACEMVP